MNDIIKYYQDEFDKLDKETLNKTKYISKKNDLENNHTKFLSELKLNMKMI